MTQKSCAVGMRNAKLGNHLKWFLSYVQHNFHILPLKSVIPNFVACLANSTKYGTCINPSYSSGRLLLEAYDTNAPITRILSHIAVFQKFFCHYSSLWMRLQHIDQLWFELEYTCQTLHLCKHISYFVVSWRHHTLE